MKHESNDTPPFAPDDPISRSLFVRPNLIERLCASALRLCLLVCIPAAASVFLISLADSVEAACTSEPSQHYEVTTLIADHPVQTSSDPDFEEILKANARIAVESGEWSRRVKRKEETLIQWMRSPVFPEFRPMAVKTTLIRRPTGLSVEDIRRAELFNDVSRLLLFFDSRAGGQVNFAMRMLSTASFAIRGGGQRCVRSGKARHARLGRPGLGPHAPSRSQSLARPRETHAVGNLRLDPCAQCRRDSGFPRPRRPCFEGVDRPLRTRRAPRCIENPPLIGKSS